MDKSAKKKVSKCDLKKLASLGLASGLMLAAAPAHADSTGQLTGTYLAAGCGGGGGSGHQCNTPSGNNQGQGGQYRQAPQQNSCNAMSNRNQAPRQNDSNATSYRSANQSCKSRNGCGGGESQNYSNIPYYNPNNSVADNDDAPKAEFAMMSEVEFMSKLNAQSKATFQGMSPEGKALAMKLAQQECKGKNTCKGLNSCKGKGNDCAGKGGCKGTSPGKFKDMNQAVKVAAMKMSEKREGSLKP